MEAFNGALTETAKSLTTAANAIREGNAATMAHTKALKDEREAFAKNATRIVRAIAGLGAFVAVCSIAIVWQVRDYANRAEATGEAAAVRAERLALAVDATRDDAREARDAVADAPRIEVVAPVASGSAPTLVLVAPVAKPAHAKAGSPLPPPSASVPLSVEVAPATGSSSGGAAP